MVRTITRDVIELEPQILLSRELLQGAALVRDDVELVAWHLYDEARPTATATAQGVLHPDDAVFDTLQTGPEWTEDDEGYNLSVRIPGAHLTPGGTTLRLEVILHVFNTEDTDEDYAEHTVRWFLRVQSRRTA